MSTALSIFVTFFLLWLMTLNCIGKKKLVVERKDAFGNRVEYTIIDR